MHKANGLVTLLQLLSTTLPAAANEDPVLFDTAEIPWWAWVRRFHLPEVRHEACGLEGMGAILLPAWQVCEDWQVCQVFLMPCAAG